MRMVIFTCIWATAAHPGMIYIEVRSVDIHLRSSLL